MEPYIEPTYANIYQAEGECVHGLLFKVSKSDGEAIDKQERWYSVVKVQVETYDGRNLEAEVYVQKAPCSTKPPSKRYINLIIRGAIEIGLIPEYIQMLQSIIPYSPCQDTLQHRKTLLENNHSLPIFTIENLKQHNGDFPDRPIYSCVVGFIFEVKPLFKSLWGRDITLRKLLHYRGESVDLNDDGGKSPFPVLEKLIEEEREYCYQALDQYAMKGKLVGLLKEFWDDQKPNLSKV